MASRKWIAEDGKSFDKKADVLEYENRTPHLSFLQGSGLGEDVARTVMDYFEKNFRSPKPRAPRKAKPEVAAAPTNAAVEKGKKK